MILASELAGGQILPPPLPLRVILDPIPGRWLKILPPPPVFRNALQLPMHPKTVEKHSRSSTPRLDHGAIRALRQSPGPEAPQVSEEPYTDSLSHVLS